MSKGFLEMMKVKPLELPLHPAEFLSFVAWSIKSGKFFEQYRRDTGKDILRIAASSPLDRLIDEAAGLSVRETRITTVERSL